MTISIKSIELPPAPVDIQTFCSLIIWRNADNITYEDITGYEIKLINMATNEEVNISLDASATFYSLDKLEDETLKHEATMIQVVMIQLGLHAMILSFCVCCMQIRVVSGNYLGLLSPHKSLGNYMILLAALLLALRDSRIAAALRFYFFTQGVAQSFHYLHQLIFKHPVT